MANNNSRNRERERTEERNTRNRNCYTNADPRKLRNRFEEEHERDADGRFVGKEGRGGGIGEGNCGGVRSGCRDCEERAKDDNAVRVVRVSISDVFREIDNHFSATLPAIFNAFFNLAERMAERSREQKELMDWLKTKELQALLERREEREERGRSEQETVKDCNHATDSDKGAGKDAGRNEEAISLEVANKSLDLLAEKAKQIIAECEEEARQSRVAYEKKAHLYKRAWFLIGAICGSLIPAVAMLVAYLVIKL